MELKNLLHDKEFLILDGAMGSELQARGIFTGLPLWSAHALLNCPEEVYRIHLDYIDAGADIITTNTFRTNLRTFLKAGMSKNDAGKATEEAVKLAKKAVRDSGRENILIAGSVAPIEDCYSPELAPDYETAYSEHKILVEWLVSSGVDLLLLETFNTMKEAGAAARAASESGIPFICSFILDKSINLLSGESFIKAVEEVRKFNPVCISVNCVSPYILDSTVNRFREIIPDLKCGYANLGKSDYGDNEILERFSPEEYLVFIKKWIQKGMKILGGCCGSAPEHIGKLSRCRF